MLPSWIEVPDWGGGSGFFELREDVGKVLIIVYASKITIVKIVRRM
jgi:hypothetical protein